MPCYLVQEAGSLKPDQMTQLATARHSLVAKMQQLVGRRSDIARLVQTGGQESAENQQPLLGNMAQVSSNSITCSSGMTWDSKACSKTLCAEIS